MLSCMRPQQRVHAKRLGGGISSRRARSVTLCLRRAITEDLTLTIGIDLQSGGVGTGLHHAGGLPDGSPKVASGVTMRWSRTVWPLLPLGVTLSRGLQGVFVARNTSKYLDLVITNPTS